MTLHHIGVLVPDIAAAADDYVGNLGYERRTGILHDATQTALVQFLCLPGNAVFIELVSPDGPASKLSNALKKGGGLNHLCYATDDIEGACRELRSRSLFQMQAAVGAVAFGGRRIAWFLGPGRLPIELVERGVGDEL